MSGVVGTARCAVRGGINPERQGIELFRTPQRGVPAKG
jgi:hypothetical protein